MAPQPGTTDSLASYLTTGFHRDKGRPPLHWDVSSDQVLTVNLNGLDANGKALARAALDAWETVANLTFRETTSRADITFTDNPASNPNTTTPYNPANGDLQDVVVNVPTSWLGQYGTTVGSYSFQTYLHEIGHALGLGHPSAISGYGSYSSAKFTNDSWQQSVMSYIDQDENPNVRAAKAFDVTPMMADIVAIQSLYGAPPGGPSAGNTTYGLGAKMGTYMDGVFGSGAGSVQANALTIYDRSGTDTFDFSDDRSAQKVDLNAGAFSSVYGKLDNLAIARGTIIENYRAGAGADQVTGNSAANLIKGNAGDDRIFGMNGNDIGYGGTGNDGLYGGAGNDDFLGEDGDDILDGSAGDDKLRGFAGIDTVTGGDGNDTLKGGDSNDRVDGGAGNDLLLGEAGTDRVDGGAGDDSLYGGSGPDSIVFNGGRDVVLDFEDNLDTLLLDDRMWGGGRTVDEVLSFAKVVNGDVVFNFGGGNTLTIDGLVSTLLMLDDISII